MAIHSIIIIESPIIRTLYDNTLSVIIIESPIIRTVYGNTLSIMESPVIRTV